MVAAMIEEEEGHASGEMTKQASVENGDGAGAPSAATPGGQETATPEASLLGKRRGRCKWFNVAKGWGFITPDDNTQDVFVHQSVIKMTGFRSLGDEEEVEFSCKPSDKGLEATQVTACGGGDCCGSHRRPVSKKRFRKIRCYNCGEFANHIAAKCTMGPQPKRCHHCKSEDHLIADCPSRPEKKKGPKGEDLDTDEELDEEEVEEEEEEVEELATKLEGLDVKEEK